MKLSLRPTFLALILCVNSFVGRLDASEKVLLSSEEEYQYLNVSSMLDSPWSSLGKTADFCSIEQELTNVTLFDNIYLLLGKIKNDIEVGLCYGLYIPTIVGLSTTPLILIFSKYVGNPYDKSISNLLIIFSLSEEELLEIVRKLWIPDYSSVIRGSAKEEFLFRFIGLTAIEAHVRYLLEKLEYSIEETNNKSQSYAIAISSIAFGLSHLTNPNPQPIQVLSTTLGGFYFGYIYSDNGIISPVTAHIVHNLLIISIVKILRWYVLRLST